MVTLKDVARVANVSQSTASAVLGKRATQLRIKEETCHRVLQAAAKLNYRKNEIAVQMKANKSNMIAFFVSASCVMEFSFEISVGAGVAAERAGCYIKTVIINDDSDLQKQLDYTLGLRPAALICIGSFPEYGPLLYEAARECNLPLVHLDFNDRLPYKTVMSDDTGGIRSAVQHLHKLGHVNILHVSDPHRAEYSELRYRVFLTAMQELKLPLRDDYLFYDLRCPEERAEISKRLREIFLGPDAPTAICCGSDYFGIYVISFLQSINIRVPEDVSVIGFGNLSFSECCHPQLTTIHQPFQEIGDRAVELALSENFLKQSQKPILLSTKLIERESTCQVR